MFSISVAKVRIIFELASVFPIFFKKNFIFPCKGEENAPPQLPDDAFHAVSAKKWEIKAANPMPILAWGLP